MTLHKEYNLIDDKEVVNKLNILSVPLIVIFGALFAGLGYLIKGNFEFDFSVYNFVLILGIYLLSILVHELIHGLFFKIFNKNGKVKFGTKNGLVYATSPNSLYSKKQFYIIVLAPFVVLSTLFTIALIFDVFELVEYIIIATVHASACVGDFYWIYLLKDEPKTVKVEDTEKGMNVYRGEFDAA